MNNTISVSWIETSQQLPPPNTIVFVEGGLAIYKNGKWYTGSEYPPLEREIEWEVKYWAKISVPIKTASLLPVDSQIEIRPNKCSGQPVIKGTRFTIGQLLSELVDGDSIDDIAEDYDLDVVQVKLVLADIAKFINKIDK